MYSIIVNFIETDTSVPIECAPAAIDLTNYLALQVPQTFSMIKHAYSMSKRSFIWDYSRLVINGHSAS